LLHLNDYRLPATGRPRENGVELQSIDRTSVAAVFGEAYRERLSGHLTIVSGSVRRHAYWISGELVLITSDAPSERLAAFAGRDPELAKSAGALNGADPLDEVTLFRGSPGDRGEQILRDWKQEVANTLFSIAEGTAFFTESPPLAASRAITGDSTAALILRAVRQISNGLLLRRSLGDLKRVIRVSRNGRVDLDSLPLAAAEREVIRTLAEPEPIESFLKRFPPASSATAAKAAAAMLAIGIFEPYTPTTQTREADFDDTQRQMTLLASLGNDQRSLEAASFARKLPSLDHYQVLNIPRAAKRPQILARAEELKQIYDPKLFPPMVRDEILAIALRVDEALSVLAHPTRRPEYDRMISSPAVKGEQFTLQQRVARHSIAEENIAKADQLVLTGDYYGAILLLKAALGFAPNNATGWFLLGSCQEKNPKWRYAAVASFQRAIDIDPNHVDAILALGDLYKAQGMAVRAQNCFEDVLRIDPENERAKKRLKTPGR
jgi:tetratricopeptide (TPR) repeat protein